MKRKYLSTLVFVIFIFSTVIIGTFVPDLVRSDQSSAVSIIYLIMLFYYFLGFLSYKYKKDWIKIRTKVNVPYFVSAFVIFFVSLFIAGYLTRQFESFSLGLAALVPGLIIFAYFLIKSESVEK